MLKSFKTVTRCPVLENVRILDFSAWIESDQSCENFSVLDSYCYNKLIMEGILTVPTLQKEILTVPTVPTVTPMPPVMPALQPTTIPTNLGWVYCDLVVGNQMITILSYGVISDLK